MQLITLPTQPLDQILRRGLLAARARLHRTWRRQVSHAKTHIGLHRPLARAGFQGIRDVGDGEGEFLTFAQITQFRLCGR